MALNRLVCNLGNHSNEYAVTDDVAVVGGLEPCSEIGCTGLVGWKRPRVRGRREPSRHGLVLQPVSPTDNGPLPA